MTGDQAPDFVLEDQDRKLFTLSEERGKRVLLSFHPLAWTKVCAEQMLDLEENSGRFEDLNTTAVGISVDATPSKRAWADKLGLKKTRMLSDFWPHGDVARYYSIFREKQGTSERANVVVDEKGKIVFFKIYEIAELPDIEEVVNFLKSL